MNTMKTWNRLCVAGLMALGIGLEVMAPAIAANFDQREVNQNQFILVASPYGRGSHQLLILEQLSRSRQCWREYGSNPVMVEPLLLNFDFTGICDRSTDSNGYSLRIAGQDLGLQYGFRLVPRNNDLVLMAYPLSDRRAPEIELGRTNGIPNGFGKIMLDPGWRLTRRVYQRRNLSHIYLTRDDLPSGLSLAAAPTTSVPSASVPAASVPATFQAPIATSPQTSQPVQRPIVPPRPRPGTAVLTAPVEIPVPPPATSQQPSTSTPGSLPTLPPSASGVLPVPNSQIPLGNAGSGLPTITISQTPGTRSNAPRQSSNLAAALGYNYRVVVPLDKPGVEAKVRGLVPDAFRTRLNGQLMMQVGLFQERYEAEDIQQRLAGQNLEATIVPVN